MAFPRLGGPGVGFSVARGLATQQTGTPPIAGIPLGFTNAITMQPASLWNIPAGTLFIVPGPYTCIQFLDPVSSQWRTLNAENSLQPQTVDSDGGNYRLANLTGTPIGALITNTGAGYTNGIGTAATGLTITPSAGASVWVPVVGGGLNSTVIVTNAGSGYTFPPILIIDAPPAGGIQATAVVTALSAGTIIAANVTVTNSGAGYLTAPNVTVVNDPRDTTGKNAVVTFNATLTGSGALLAMYPSNPGNVVTAVPTFTFAPASTTAATAIMNFTITGLTVTGGGTAVPAGSALMAIFGALPTAARAANTAGPISDINLVQPRPAWIQPSITGGVVQATANLIVDAGYGFQTVPTLGLVSSTGVAPTAGINITPTVGGTTDTTYIMAI